MLNFSLISPIPDNKIVAKINDPNAPATLLAIPMMAIRFAALSIGPKIVIYGLEAVCNKVIPMPCIKIADKNIQYVLAFAAGINSNAPSDIRARISN